MKQRVLQGIDRTDRLDALLKGHRLGIVSSGGVTDRSLRHSVDVLRARYRVTALFNTVMGLRGEFIYGEDVPEYTDAASGMPVISIFNRKTLAPTEAMMREVDVLVFDAREAGVRFFEYLHCCAAILKACAAQRKPMVVLDRVAPLGGVKVEGTVCPPGMHTIVGDYQLPTRTALTIGECIRYVNGEYAIGCDLTVVPLEGWTRDLYHDDTDLPWLLPSPSLPHLTANLLYAGLCVLEGIENLSEGRGTSKPFELVGAPWLDADTLAERLRAAALPAADFARVYFKPASSNFKGEVCSGIQIIPLDKRAFEPFLTAMTMLDIIRDIHPGMLVFSDNAIGHDVLRQPTEPVFTRYFDQLLATDAYSRGEVNAAQLVSRYAADRERFEKRKAAYHLYG